MYIMPKCLFLEFQGWSEWSECHPTCGAESTQARQRACTSGDIWDCVATFPDTDWGEERMCDHITPCECNEFSIDGFVLCKVFVI